MILVAPVGVEMTVLLFIRKGERESEEAVRLLGECSLKVRVLHADDPQIAPFIVHDLGTAVTPTLVTEHYVLPGLSLIRGFVDSEKERF